MPHPDAQYMRAYRERNPGALERDRLGRTAYRRALTVLRQRHGREFTKILTAERAALGLPPAGTVKPGPKRKARAA